MAKHNSLTQLNPTSGLGGVVFFTHVMGWKFLIPALSSWILKNIIQLDSYTPLHIIIIQACKPFLSSSPGCTNVQQHFFLNIIFFNGPFTAFSFLFHILIKVVNNVSVI